MSVPTAAGAAAEGLTRDPGAALALLWRFAEAAHGHKLNGEGYFGYKAKLLGTISATKMILLKHGKTLDSAAQINEFFRSFIYLTGVDSGPLSTAWFDKHMAGFEARFTHAMMSHETIRDLLDAAFGSVDGLGKLTQELYCEVVAKIGAIGVRHPMDISLSLQFVVRVALLVVVHNNFAYGTFDAAQFVKYRCENCLSTHPIYGVRSDVPRLILRMANAMMHAGSVPRGVPQQSLSSSPPRRHEPWSPPSPRRHLGPRQEAHVPPHPSLFSFQSNTAVGTSPPTIAPPQTQPQPTVGPTGLPPPKPSATDLKRQFSSESMVCGAGGAPPSVATGTSGKTQCRTALIVNYDSSDIEDHHEGGDIDLFGGGGKSDPLFDHVEQAAERALAAQDEAAARLREETQKLQNETSAALRAMQLGEEQEKRLEEERARLEEERAHLKAQRVKEGAHKVKDIISRIISQAVVELKQKYVLEWHNIAEDAKRARHHDTGAQPTEAEIAAAEAVRDENEAKRKAIVSLPYEQELPATRLRGLFDPQLAHLLGGLLSFVHYFGPDDMLRVHHIFAVPLLTWFEAHMEPAHFAKIFPEGGPIPITCVNDMTEVFKKIMTHKKFKGKRVAAARDLYDGLAKDGEGIFRGDANTLLSEGTEAKVLETVFMGLLLAMGIIPAVATKTDMIFPVYRIAVILLRAVQRLSHERKVDAKHQCVPWQDGIKIKAPGGADINERISSLLRETCPNCR